MTLRRLSKVRPPTCEAARDHKDLGVFRCDLDSDAGGLAGRRLPDRQAVTVLADRALYDTSLTHADGLGPAALEAAAWQPRSQGPSRSRRRRRWRRARPAERARCRGWNWRRCAWTGRSQTALVLLTPAPAGATPRASERPIAATAAESLRIGSMPSRSPDAHGCLLVLTEVSQPDVYNFGHGLGRERHVKLGLARAASSDRSVAG
jgi:hypothetical protein